MDVQLPPAIEKAKSVNGPRPTVTTLRTAPLLAELPAPRLASLAEVASWHVYSAGEVVARQNEAARAVYIVISGYVKVMRGGAYIDHVLEDGASERRARSREQVMVTLLGPGELVGEVSVLLGHMRSHSIVTLTPCEVISLPSAEFLATLQSDSTFATSVARRMAAHLEASDQRIELLRGSLEGRIHALLRHCRSMGLDTDRWLTNAEIARMVGATRVAVSLAMNRSSRSERRDGSSQPRQANQT